MKHGLACESIQACIWNYKPAMPYI